MDVAKKLRIGSIVWADIQTSGRGKPGNNWISQNGNLACSFVMPLEAHLDQIVALKVKQVLMQFLKEEVIFKLPNDLYVLNRKICGVLVENEQDKAIVGIGLNIASSPAGFISLKELNIDISVNYVLMNIAKVLGFIAKSWC